MADTVRSNTLTPVLRRVPTLVGLVLGTALLISWGGVNEDTIDGIATVVVLLPLLYLVVAALGAQKWTWPVLAASLPFMILARLQPWVPPVVVLFAVAAVAIAWGAVKGLHHTHDFRLQIVGMVAFGALGLAGLAVDLDVAAYIVAAGWLGHAFWDWVHLNRNRVIHPFYAESCAAMDLLVATAIVVLAIGM